MNKIHQLEVPGTEPDVGGLLQKKADARLQPKQAQKPCDVGLFSDERKQQELF